MSTFSILNFNILFGKALPEAISIIKREKPDIVCFQEFIVLPETIKKIEETGLRLADFSFSFYRLFKFFGVVTFYNPARFTYQETQIIDLKRSTYEFIFFLFRQGPCRRTVLNNQFIDKETGKTLDVYNVHLTALQATNQVRLQQLESVMKHIRAVTQRPTIILGDFNYAYNKKGLEKVLNDNQLQEITKEILYTCDFKALGLFLVRTKMDYCLYRHLTPKRSTRLFKTISDHYPIFSQFFF